MPLDFIGEVKRLSNVVTSKKACITLYTNFYERFRKKDYKICYTDFCKLYYILKRMKRSQEVFYFCKGCNVLCVTNRHKYSHKPEQRVLVSHILPKKVN